MNRDARPLRPDSQAALEEGLAEWFGWFESAPLPDHLINLIDQLETDCGFAPAES